MSYEIYLYHPLVRKEVESGQELDEVVHPPFGQIVITGFINRLRLYGYLPQSQTEECKLFCKLVDDTHVDVSIYNSEIVFIVSGGDSDVIFEVLQDASELSDSPDLALFNPQLGEWQED